MTRSLVLLGALGALSLACNARLDSDEPTTPNDGSAGQGGGKPGTAGQGGGGKPGTGGQGAAAGAAGTAGAGGAGGTGSATGGAGGSGGAGGAATGGMGGRTPITITDKDVPPLPEPVPIPPPAPFACEAGKDVPGPRRLWRLSPLQVKNTVAAFWVGRGVLGQWKNAPPKDLDLLVPFDGVNNADRFNNFARSFTMSEDELWNVTEAAQRMAAQVVDEGRAKGCVGKGAGLGACIRDFLAGWGQIAYSRPLSGAELDELARIATEAAPTIGEREASILAVQALFSSPHFFYRAEGMGGTPEGRVVKMTPYEVAAGLSFGLADMPPDDLLYDAAKRGELSTPEQLRPHVDRMMGMTQKFGVAPKIRFFREYTYYDGAPGVFKDTKAYAFHRAPMLVEDVDTWFYDLLARHKNGGFLTAFLTSPTAFVRGSYTQTNYGLTGLPQTEQRTRYDLDPKQRAGILTQPAFLVALSQMEDSDPVKRGKFVRENLLCGAVPPLNGTEVPPLPQAKDRPLRDRLRVHSSLPQCWGCHQFMDPLGLLFETHDHLGRVKTKEVGNRPVDGSGYLTGAGAQDGKLNGVVELAQRLAASPVVSECFVRHTFEFYMGRSVQPGDHCTVAKMVEAFEKDGGDYLGMMTALFSSRTFLYRSAE